MALKCHRLTPDFNLKPSLKIHQEKYSDLHQLTPPSHLSVTR